MQDLTPKFYELLYQETKTHIERQTQEIDESPLDKASLNILKLFQTCIIELNKLTPEILRETEGRSKMRGWITGLLSDCASSIKIPTYVNFHMAGSSTAAELDDELQQIKSMLLTAGECIVALEQQLEKESIKKSKLSFRSELKPVAEHWMHIIAILNCLKNDLNEVTSHYELRALSWQVSVKQVFDAARFSKALSESNESEVKEKFRSISMITSVSAHSSSERSRHSTYITEALNKIEVNTPRFLEKDTHLCEKKASQRHSVKTTIHTASQKILPSQLEEQRDDVQLILLRAMDKEELEEDIVLSISSKVTRISELMTTFATKVMEQQDLTESILSATHDAIDSMQQAARELDKALNIKWSFRTYLFVLYLVTGCCLLCLDLLTSWRLL